MHERAWPEIHIYAIARSLITGELTRAATLRALNKMPTILAAIFLIGSEPLCAQRLVGFVIRSRPRPYAIVTATDVDGHCARAFAVTLAHCLWIGVTSRLVSIRNFEVSHRYCLTTSVAVLTVWTVHGLDLA